MLNNECLNLNPSLLTAVDFFAGCGGLSLGFQNAGFKMLAAFDNWEAAIEVYKKNFNHQIFNYDLSKLDNIEFLKQFKPDIILGGPPCQDFSSAGKRNEELGRGDLTISFAEIISQIKPQWFVMENVERLATSQKYQQCREILKKAGYGLNEVILDASLCGVPQKRKRFFCVGKLRESDRQIEPFFKINLANKAMTVRDYLGDSLGIANYYRHPRSYKRRAIFSIDEPSPTVRGVNRPIPKNYQRHPGDTALISENVRPLTTLERSYLQTFPENFIFDGSKTDLEQMIGNAVPVRLAEYVAQCIRQYLEKKARSISDVGNQQLVSQEKISKQFCLPIYSQP